MPRNRNYIKVIIIGLTLCTFGVTPSYAQFKKRNVFEALGDSIKNFQTKMQENKAKQSELKGKLADQKADQESSRNKLKDMNSRAQRSIDDARHQRKAAEDSMRRAKIMQDQQRQMFDSNRRSRH